MSDKVDQEAPNSPASKYGKESDFGQILDFIQGIVSDEALRHEFDIPHLVVVGRQNMAKTTLINRLIGRYLLPMRKDVSATHLQALTTCPIILNLRPHKEPMYKIVISVHGRQDMGGTVLNPEDGKVDDFLREVGKRLPKEEGTEISTTPVTVTLYGPELTTLTLVDLPGVHFANDNDQMNKVTQKLMLDYIKKNKKSVIVLVSQVGDPTGDSAINLVMKNAQDYKSRTICVLTKPDKHNQQDDLGRKVATNQSSFTLEDGQFILLKGKDAVNPEERDWDAQTTRIKEKEWFSVHPQYSDLTRICGIDCLMRTMIKMLSLKMIEEIPHLIEKMKGRKQQLEHLLESLNKTAVPHTDAGKGKLMSSLQSKLITGLETLLFNNTTSNSGGEKVRHRILKFNESILKIDPLEGRTDDEIMKLLRKLEGVSAPLGDSSENNQLLDMLLHRSFDKGSLAWSSTSMLPSPIDELTKVCKTLVEDVEKELKQIVLSAVKQTFLVFPDLEKSVSLTVVPKIFSEKQGETMNFIEQLIQMQKKSVDVIGVDVLMPEEFENAIKTLINNEYSFQTKQGRIACLSGNTNQDPEIFTQIRDLSQKLHSTSLVKHVTSCEIEGASYKVVNQIINIKKNVIRCFNNTKLNVIDTVPRCIQHFFVTQLVQSLTKELESADLMEFLQEKEDVRTKRETAQRTLDSINYQLPQTEHLTPMLLRIKQGRSAVGE